LYQNLNSILSIIFLKNNKFFKIIKNKIDTKIIFSVYFLYVYLNILY
jgi:hypothetical protein